MKSSSRPWLGVAILAGVAYLAIGKGFTLPHSHVTAWRRAAWLASGVVFAVHFWYEQITVAHRTPRSVAAHVAAAVAIGAGGLAALGVIHDMTTGGGVRPLMMLSLVLWPLVTAIPAFVLAFVAAAAFTRSLRTAES